MDTADWILIIILVVICAIALVWFGAWLCNGSAPAGARVTGQGEAAKNAVRTAMSVFDYVRPRSKIAVGTSEYFGGVGEDRPWLIPVTSAWLQQTASIENDDVRHGTFLNAFKFKPNSPDEEAVDKFNLDYAPPNVSTTPKQVLIALIDGIRNALSTLTDDNLNKLASAILNMRGSAGAQIPLNRGGGMNVRGQLLSNLRVQAKKNGVTLTINGVSEDTDTSKTSDDEFKDSVQPQLAEEVADLTSKVSSLTADLAAASQTVEKLKQENEILAGSKNAATEEARKVQEALATITERVGALEGEKIEAEKTLKTVTAEKDELANKNRGLSESLNELQLELSKAAGEKNVLDAKVPGLESKIGVLETEIRQVKAEKESAEKLHETQIQRLQLEKEAAEAANTAGAAAAKAEFDRQIQDLQAQAATAATNYDAKIAGLQDELARLHGDLEAANKLVNELKTKSDELQEKIRSLEGALATTRDEAAKRDGEIARLTAMIAEKGGELSGVQEQLRQRTDELRRSNEQIVELERQLSASNAAIEKGHAIVKELLDTSTQLIEGLSALREQEAADVRAIERRLETLATKPDMDIDQLIATHQTLSSAADETAFQTALRDAMARDPVHAVASMIVTDRKSLESAQARLDASLAAVVALKGVSENAPKEESKGFFGPLVDWVANMGSNMSSAIDGLVSAIEKDRVDIKTLQTRATEFEREINDKLRNMGAEITDLKTRMDAVEKVAAAAPTAGTVADLKQQMDALRSQVASIDEGADQYEEEYLYYPPKNSISPQTLAGL